MANTFVHPLSDVASIASKLTGSDFNLAALVYADIAAEYAAGKGSTIAIPVPGSLPSHSKSAADKTTALVVDELNEQTIPVTLDDMVYSLVALSVADYDLSLKDYARSVLRPQTRALSAAVEARVAATMAATPASTIPYDAANPAKAFTAARAELRANGVPSDAPLIAVVGSSVYADLLDASALETSDGKVRGFKIVESTRVSATDIIAFTPTAFALVVRAPMVPAGAPNGASIKTEPLNGENGSAFAVTVLNVFDGSTAVDRSLVQALVKVQAMPLPVDDEVGTVTLVPHGGAVRIDTAA